MLEWNASSLDRGLNCLIGAVAGGELPAVDVEASEGVGPSDALLLLPGQKVRSTFERRLRGRSSEGVI